MIDQDVLVRSVIEATSEVFSMMLDMEVRHDGTVSDSRMSDNGLISLVGITGEWGGSGVFCCTPACSPPSFPPGCWGERPTSPSPVIDGGSARCLVAEDYQHDGGGQY